MGHCRLTGTAVGVIVSVGVAVAVLVCVGGGVSVGGTVAVADGVQVIVGEGIAVELGTSVGNGSVATAAKAIGSLSNSDTAVCWQPLPKIISIALTKSINNVECFINAPPFVDEVLSLRGKRPSNETILTTH